MVEIPLMWRLNIQGAEQVKQRFNEINEAFARGEISAAQYAKQLREVNREARSVTNTLNVQKNVFLASHPAILSMTRAMSAVSSVSRTLLSVINAINLARIAGNSMTSEESSLLMRKLELERELLGVNDDTIDGMQRRKSIEEELRVLVERLAQIDKEKGEQAITNYIQLAAAIGLIAGSITQVVSKLGPMLAGLGGMRATLGAISLLSMPLTALLGTVAAFAGAFLAGYFGAMALFEALGITKLGLGDLQYWYWAYVEPALTDMWNFFTKGLPTAFSEFISYVAGNFQPFFLAIWQSITLGLFTLWERIQNAWVALWGNIQSITTSIMQNIIESVINFVNRIVGFIQTAINTLRQLLNMSGGGGGGGMQEVHVNPATGRPFGLAHGFEGVVTQPTLFMAGEAGPESISVMPHTSRAGSVGGGAGGGVTIIVQGSVISERELFRLVDNYLKGALKSSGWT